MTDDGEGYTHAESTAFLDTYAEAWSFEHDDRDLYVPDDQHMQDVLLDFIDSLDHMGDYGSGSEWFDYWWDTLADAGFSDEDIRDWLSYGGD